MSFSSSIHWELKRSFIQLKYAWEKQAALDSKIYLLMVTRNHAAVATALNMPWGKEIMYTEIIALIVAMTTWRPIHSSCIQIHICSFFLKWPPPIISFNSLKELLHYYSPCVDERGLVEISLYILWHFFLCFSDSTSIHIQDHFLVVKTLF